MMSITGLSFALEKIRVIGKCGRWDVYSRGWFLVQKRILSIENSGALYGGQEVGG